MKSTIFALEKSLAGRLAAGFAPLPRDSGASVRSSRRRHSGHSSKLFGISGASVHNSRRSHSQLMSLPFGNHVASPPFSQRHPFAETTSSVCQNDCVLFQKRLRSLSETSALVFADEGLLVPTRQRSRSNAKAFLPQPDVAPPLLPARHSRPAAAPRALRQARPGETDGRRSPHVP